MSATTPILLVHGLGGGLKTWIRLIRYLTDPQRGSGFRYGGQLIYRRDKRGRWVLHHSHAGLDGRGSLYVLSFPDTYEFLHQPRGLKEAIEWLKRTTGAGRVSLITHSMGGLVARCYLAGLDGLGREMPYLGDVARLIQLAPPNQGTPWAHSRLFRWVRVAREVLAEDCELLKLLNRRDLPEGNGERYAVYAGLLDRWTPVDRTPLRVDAGHTVQPIRFAVDHVAIHDSPAVLEAIATAVTGASDAPVH